MLEDGYYKHGIRSFWLDASEPEYYEFPQVRATNDICRAAPERYSREKRSALAVHLGLTDLT